MGEAMWLMKSTTISVSSHKTLIKEVLFYKMKCTFEEFVLPYVNAIVFVILIFG
jgi:hypothetical protein